MVDILQKMVDAGMQVSPYTPVVYGFLVVLLLLGAIGFLYLLYRYWRYSEKKLEKEIEKREELQKSIIQIMDDILKIQEDTAISVKDNKERLDKMLIEIKVLNRTVGKKDITDGE